MKELALQFSLALFSRPRFGYVPDRPDPSDGIAFAVEDRL